MFSFTPVTRPDRASEARNYAYLQRTFIPGPILDPYGWQTSNPVKVSGTLFRQRRVSVIYTVSLSTSFDTDQRKDLILFFDSFLLLLR